jgi:3-oxoacyl-[acyl-carrier protein] reductase
VSSHESKRILVTGSTSGLGYAIACKFANSGGRVVLNGRSKRSIQSAELPDGIEAFVSADVATPVGAKSLVEESVARLGGIDVLVCNVGSGTSVKPGEESYDEWQRVFHQNLFAATNAVEASKEHLAKSKGVVICISSICGHEVVPGAPTTYSVAKAALNMYIKSAARSLGECGVRINGVEPGNLLFSGSSWEQKLAANPVQVNEMIQKEVVLGRFGSDQEVANVVGFLASDEASFVTGSIWTIDGGQVKS